MDLEEREESGVLRDGLASRCDERELEAAAAALQGMGAVRTDTALHKPGSSTGSVPRR